MDPLQQIENDLVPEYTAKDIEYTLRKLLIGQRLIFMKEAYRVDRLDVHNLHPGLRAFAVTLYSDDTPLLLFFPLVESEDS